MRNIVSPLEGIRSPFGPRFGTAFSPASLFAAGEQGVWYDPSDFTTMFQDSVGTTPVTAVEQPVGRILDKSGRGNTATQATSASRPVLSARVNLLTKTEQFDDAVWTKTSTTVTANAAVAPDGTTTADAATPNTTGFSVLQSVLVSGTYTASVSVKDNGAGSCHVSMGSNTVGYLINLNLSTGAFISGRSYGGGSLVGYTIQTQGNGWWRITVTATAGAGGVLVAAADGTSPTSGVFVWGADLRVTNDGVGLPAYQRVNTSTDYDTTGFPYYLRFDGTDDSMATGTITPGIDKAQVFAGVRKLSDAATGVLAEFSTNAGSLGGSFYVAAPVVPSFAYQASSRGFGGIVALVSVAASSYPAPITNVLSSLGDISGDLLTLRLNGVQAAQAASDQGSGNFITYPLYIGSRGGSSLRFNGRIYSLIVRFGANLDATTITNTETWVNGKTMAY